MNDDNIEPTGPPPVTKATEKASNKATKINIKNLNNATEPKSSKSDSQTVDDTPNPEVPETPETPDTSDAPPIPVTAADKDLQSLDMSDDTPPATKPKLNTKSGGSKKKLWIVVVILLILVAAAAYWFLRKPKKAQAPAPTPAASAPSQTPSSQSTAPTIKTYKNDTIKVELSYPSTWKATETASQVTFTSPQVSYTKKDGSTTKGSFRLIVQKGFNQADSTAINNAVAVKTSENLKYTAPATGQRTESFLSFLGADKTTFNFILITSGKQYNPGDTVAATLPLSQDSYIVAGGYGTGTKSDDTVTIDFDSISPTKIDQNEVYTQAVDIIKSLKITG